MTDWTEFVDKAFAVALAIFGFLFLYVLADFSSLSASIESLEHFVLAFGYSLKPTGLSLFIDAVAASITGVVSFKAVKENVLFGLFIALVLYFFFAILGNYLFVVS